jgi:hypothetical protein
MIIQAEGIPYDIVCLSCVEHEDRTKIEINEDAYNCSNEHQRVIMPLAVGSKANSETNTVDRCVKDDVAKFYTNRVSYIFINAKLSTPPCF